MSRCVPSWCSSSSSSDYEVAELTWENGQLALHGLGPSRVPHRPLPSSPWEKPRAGGTLESIVNQAAAATTTLPSHQPHNNKSSGILHNSDTAATVAATHGLVPWLEHNHRASAATSGSAMNVLVVPSPALPEDPPVVDSAADSVGVPSLTGSAATLGRDSGRQVTTPDTRETELGCGSGGFTTTISTSSGNADEHHSPPPQA